MLRARGTLRRACLLDLCWRWLRPEVVPVVEVEEVLATGDDAAVLGGFTVLDVPSREAALEWAAKIAAACRCAQEFREFMPDPAVGN